MLNWRPTSGPGIVGQMRIAAPRSWRFTSAMVGAQHIQQLGFQIDLCAVVLQRGTIDQKSIFYPLTQGADFGQQHIDMVLRQDLRHAIKQSGTVAGRNTQQPTLRFLIGL